MSRYRKAIVIQAIAIWLLLLAVTFLFEEVHFWKNRADLYRKNADKLQDEKDYDATSLKQFTALVDRLKESNQDCLATLQRTASAIDGMFDKSKRKKVETH